jgi:hypothetical protein
VGQKVMMSGVGVVVHVLCATVRGTQRASRQHTAGEEGGKSGGATQAKDTNVGGTPIVGRRAARWGEIVSLN